MGHRNRSEKRSREETSRSVGKTSRKSTSKHRCVKQRDLSQSSERPASFILNYALYAYLRDCGYKKTARSLEKETEAVYHKCDAPKPDFSLAPLFKKILSELEKEASRESSVTDESATVEDTQEDSKPSHGISVGNAEYGLAAQDSFGVQAASDLGKVKGKGFRKEKNKKKRATWKGNGCISFQTQSERLDFSD